MVAMRFVLGLALLFTIAMAQFYLAQPPARRG
jgi:hypothetical protein